MWTHEIGRDGPLLSLQLMIDRSTLNNGSSLHVCFSRMQLKALDTFDNCQTPVFSLGVSQHMHKTTNLWTFLIKVIEVARDKWKKKRPFCTILCAFRCLKNASFLKTFNIWVRNHLFLKNFVTSEGAVFHNVLYYQQLSIPHYQVSFYANNRFE